MSSAFKFSKETIKDTLGIQEGRVRIVAAEENGNRPAGPMYQVYKAEEQEGDEEPKKPFVRAVIPMVSLDDDDNVVGDTDHKTFAVCFLTKKGEFVLLPSEDGETPAENEEGEAGGVGACGPFLVAMRPGVSVSPNLGMGKLAHSMVELGFDFPMDITELVNVTGDIRTEEEKYQSKKTGKEETSKSIVFAKIEAKKKGKKGAEKKEEKTSEKSSAKAKAKEAEKDEDENDGGDDVESLALKAIANVFKASGKDTISSAIFVTKAASVVKAAEYEGDEDGEIAAAVLELVKDPKWIGKQDGYSYDAATKKLTKG